MEDYWSRAGRDVDRAAAPQLRRKHPGSQCDAYPGSANRRAHGENHAGYDAPRNLRAAGEFRSADGARGIGCGRAYRRGLDARPEPHARECARIGDRGQDPGRSKNVRRARGDASQRDAADYIARLGAPASGTEKPAPVLNGKSVAEVIEAVRRGGSDAFGRIQRVQVQKREIDKEIRALGARSRHNEERRQDVRTIAVGVSAEQPGEVRVSYQVNGAGGGGVRAGLIRRDRKCCSKRQGRFLNTGRGLDERQAETSTGQRGSRLKAPSRVRGSCRCSNRARRRRRVRDVLSCRAAPLR